MGSIAKNTEDLDFFKKRAEILIGARMNTDDAVAIAIQDALRTKIRGWDGVSAIRKWRETTDEELHRIGDETFEETKAKLASSK